MENNSTVSIQPTRPWDVKALAFLHGIVALSYLMFIYFTLQSQGVIRRLFSGQDFEITETQIRSNSSMTDVVNGLGIKFWIVLIVFLILNIVLVRGVLKGRKWAPIASIIISVLSIIANYLGFGVVLLSLFNLLTLFLAITCIKSPYFNIVRI